MARNDLTRNKRAFRSNNRNFLNRVSKAPISITLDDGINPPTTVKVSPITAEILNSQALADAGYSTSVEREFVEQTDK